MTPDTPTRLSPRPRARLGALLLLLLLAACSREPTEAPPPAQPVASAAAAAAEAPTAPALDPALAYAQQLAPSLPQRVADQRVEAQLLKAIADDARQVIAAVNDPYDWRSVLRRLYVKHDTPRTRFVRGGRVSDEARAVLAFLAQLHDHGLDARDRYHVERVEAALKALDADGAAPQAAPPALAPPGDAVVEAIAARVRQAGWPLDDAARADTDARVVAMLTAPGSPWPEAAAAASGDAAAALPKKTAQHLAAVEALLIDALGRYAWDMWYANPHRFDDVLHAKLKRRERRRKLRNMLRDTVEAQIRQPSDLTAWMASMVPAHPQYTRLIDALKRYRAMQAAGGWPEARRVTGLRLGIEHDRVSRLKARLAAEGYMPAQEEYSNVYDEAAVQAVTAYQETHQMDVTGEPHKVFWRSLDVPLDERIEHIVITLQRWRESSVLDPKSYHVFVNIADFHLEVWKDGERLLRFKTVVGNTGWGCSLLNKRWVHINQTPIQTSAIEQIVVNPWWAVPERIRTQEILPAVAKDPNYMSFHNFHCIKEEDGVCVDMRQGAGKRNALGKLKFLFPSPYSTFLHDTPKKRFFEYSIRALSHGCVRLDKPVELAQLLLKHDGQFDPQEWERFFNAKHQHPYNLKTPVPIHIEYYTVRVDDDGRVHFLADIYDHDKYRRRGTRFEPRKCTAAELEHAVNPSVDDGGD